MKRMTMKVLAAVAAVGVFGCSDVPEKSVLREPGKALLSETWQGDGSAWEIVNHQNILDMGVTNLGSCAAMRVANGKEDKKSRDTLFYFRSPIFAVKPGSDFAVITEARGTVSMVSSVNPIKKDGKRTKVPATALLWFDAEKKPVLAQDPLGFMLPSGHEFGFKSQGADWARSVNLGKVPPGVAFARVQIGGDAPDVAFGGWLEVRRVTVLERDGDDWDFGDLDAPRFERLSASPDPDPNAAIRFRVSDASELDMSRFRCALDGADVTARVTREGKDVFVLKPEAPWAKDSLHLLKVEAADVLGNAGWEQLAFYCGERAKGTVKSVRDDGMLLVDGKPVFLIGSSSFRVCPPNNYDIDFAAAEAVSNGFNFGAASAQYRKDDAKRSKALDELLDAADRHGLLLQVELADRSYGTERRVRQMQDSLEHLRNRSCILFWDLADDTGSHCTPVGVRNDHNICRAIDDLHLTEQPDICSYPGRYLPFAAATDVFRLELYPFRAAEPEPHGLAQLVRDIRYAQADLVRSGAKNRSIVAIPQAFSGWGLWKRFPTREEIRAQSYLSAIHGCRGVTYYSYWSFTKGANPFMATPEQKERTFSVTREMASIHDDLASRDAKDQPSVTFLEGPKEDLCGNPSVTCLLKEGADGKGRMLLAANARNDKAVKVRIGVKGRVETLFEGGRAVDASDGLVDTFAPEAVHVYRLK